MPRALHRLFWLWLLGGASLAHAETDSKPFIQIESLGSCPSSDGVRDQLAPLLRHHELEGNGKDSWVKTAKIYDFGDAYLVRLEGVSRRIPDAERNCEERAQVAAVVVALTLEPAGGEFEPPGEGKTQVAPSEPPQVIPTPREAEPEESFALFVGAKALWTFEGYGPDLGPVLGATWLGRRFTVQFSGSLFPARSSEIAGRRVILSRYGFDFRLGPSLKAGRFQVHTILGAAFDPLVITSESFGTRNTRLDVGPSAAVALVLDKWALNPWLLFDTRWFPRDYELLILPEGEVGRTPKWYFGLSLGAQFSRF